MQQQESYSGLPNAIKNILGSNEQILASIQQSRLKAALTPDTIVITDQRIIRCSPSAFGLKKEVEDYRYQDMANFKVNKGLIFGTITIRQTFMSDDLVLDNLPKGQLDNISKLVQEKIRQSRSGGMPQQGTSSPQTEDPLKLLKTRFVKGEITKEQFEEMKKLLE